MKTFTKGQKVRAIRDTESRGGNADIGLGLVLEVSHTSDDSGHLFTAWHPNGIDVYALAKDDFEPVEPVEPATPAPLDPHAVKPGDTVTVRFIATGDVVTTKAYRPDDIKAGRWVSVLGWPLVKVDGTFGLAVKYFELLDHQPAPEPEWLFEFKGEEGPEGDEHWARRFPSRADALRSMIESANLDELNDFEGPVSFSVYTDETGPAEVPATCAHGRTAEDLCNAMPDKIELDAMWTSWKSLTPAEQRGWLEGGEGKVPTPAKVSIRTLMNGGAS